MEEFLLQLYGINDNDDNNDNDYIITNTNIITNIFHFIYSLCFADIYINKLLLDNIECLISYNIIEKNMLYYECMSCKCIYDYNILNKWFKLKTVNNPCLITRCPHCNQIISDNCIYKNL